MKIFLTAINAKYIHSNLAVYSLRAYAKDYQDQIVIGEYTINNRVDYILEQIYKAKPDVLCFSCYIWNIAYVEELSEEFHKLRPEVPIWMGGPEVSYETEAFLREHPFVTGVMVGEGEQSFSELCEYYVNEERQDGIKAEERPETIKGLAFLDEDGHMVFTGAREPIDMSTIPFCYENMEDFKNRIIYYESSRGCPFRCSYCLSSIEKKLRFRDIELVKRELAFFIEKEVKCGKLNIEVFRLYIYHWLMNNPNVSQQPRLIVRWLEQTSEGLPLQLLVYLTDTMLDAFEWQQSQIMEHVIKAMGWFDLQLYQNPSGYDASNSNIYLTQQTANYRKKSEDNARLK